MVLQAVMALVDHRSPDVDEFVELAVERAADTGVETEKVLQHVGTVRERFLHVARLALQFLVVDFFDFGRSLVGLDECDACHKYLPPFAGYNTRQSRFRACLGGSLSLTCCAFGLRPSTTFRCSGA